MVKAQGRCASPDGDYCTTKTRHACKDPSPWQERILLQGLVPPKEQWHGNRTAVAIKASSKSSSPLSSWPCFHHFVALAAHLAAHSLPTSYLAECQKSAPGSHKPSSGLVVIERASARKPPLPPAAKKCAEKSTPEGAPDATRGPCWERDSLSAAAARRHGHAGPCCCRARIECSAAVYRLYK